LNEFQDQPHDCSDEDQDQHYALSWFERSCEPDNAEDGKSEGHEKE
jgi:hypothetical protein